MNLPPQFSERIRPDIVKRAFLSTMSKRRENYGADPEAGNRHVTYFKKRSDTYRSQKGKGMSRTPRKIMLGRGMQLVGEGAEAPNARGGRRAHQPKSDREFDEHINNKERRKAIRSAIAATASDKVYERHRYDGDLPIVVEDIQGVEKTQELIEILQNKGLGGELERCRERTVRGGKGRNRGRKYETKVGPLVVVEEDQGVISAASNIPGVDATIVDQLGAEELAPGAKPGRLTIYSENALKKLEEDELFYG